MVDVEVENRSGADVDEDGAVELARRVLETASPTESSALRSSGRRRSAS